MSLLVHGYIYYNKNNTINTNWYKMVRNKYEIQKYENTNMATTTMTMTTTRTLKMTFTDLQAGSFHPLYSTMFLKC